MEIIKKIQKHFIEEDKIINKAMSKVNHLIISRGIDQSNERKELINLRNKLIKEITLQKDKRE